MPKQVTARPRKKKLTPQRAMRSGSGAASPRFKRVTKRQIQWVVDRLVQALHPEKIILFGSYAYGKPNADSDIDLLVIMESTERWTIRTTNAYRAVHGKTFPADLVVRTPQEMGERLAMGDRFIKEILERGKILYERRNS